MGNPIATKNERGTHRCSGSSRRRGWGSGGRTPRRCRAAPPARSARPPAACATSAFPPSPAPRCRRTLARTVARCPGTRRRSPSGTPGPGMCAARRFSPTPSSSPSGPPPPMPSLAPAAAPYSYFVSSSLVSLLSRFPPSVAFNYLVH